MGRPIGFSADLFAFIMNRLAGGEIPCSSQDQAGNRYAVRLASPIDGKGPSWAICDKVGCVAVSRLSLEGNSRHRLPEVEFAAVLEAMWRWLPVPRPALPTPRIEEQP